MMAGFCRSFAWRPEIATSGFGFVSSFGFRGLGFSLLFYPSTLKFFSFTCHWFPTSCLHTARILQNKTVQNRFSPPCISRHLVSPADMHTENTRNEFRRLRLRGLSLGSIGRQLGVSTTTIINWHRQFKADLRSRPVHPP